MANGPPASLPKLSRRSKILLGIGAAIVLVLILGTQLIGTYVDWLWFGSVDARGVFSTVIVTRIVLFFATGLLIGGAVAASLVIAYRTRPVFVPVSGSEDPLARYRSTVTARTRLFGIGLPVVAGLIAGAAGQGDWRRVQLFFNSTEFGQTDPEFNIDIGFYVFELPFYNWLLTWLFAALIVSFVFGLLAHYLFGGIRLAGRSGQVSGPAKVHLLTIVGVFVLLKAADYFLDRYDLLTSERNDSFTGATYTDLHAVMPAQLILLCISVICAIAFFAGAFLRNMQLPAISLVLLILSGILVGWAWPLVLQQFSVRPNELAKESPSIQRNLESTRQAYGVDDINYKKYPGESNATAEEVRSNKDTISNIRLLDPSLLTETFTQRLGIRNFYGFPEELNVDRYKQDGELQSYIVALKELDSDNLSGNQTSWVNRHMVYTHGNGFVAAPSNKINRAVESADSDGGYPLIGISNLQDPDGAHGIQVDQPRVYFGQLIDDYSIVGGKKGQAPGEYDSEKNDDFYYDGSGGVPIDSWLNRTVFAAKYGEQRILFSDAISEDSRMMFVRDPRQRVEKIAPWLTADGDPYPAVIDGEIKWIVDGYTTLNNYPYSQRTQLGKATEDTRQGVAQLQNRSINYIRNSVKATVDAYTGEVTLYAVNPDDPVLQTWMDIFPGVVQPQSEIPDELRSHFRYPADIFNVQRQIISKYHVDSPEQFYNGVFWNVPPDPTEEGEKAQGTSGTRQPPYYLLSELPGENKPTFQLTSILTPLKRQTLASFVSVSSDPKNYGDITVLQLPSERQNKVEGPVQVQNRFQSNPEYAEVRRSLSAANVEIINANLLTLPVADGFIYIEPIYIKQQGENSYPQLARVLVSYGSNVGVAATLNGALDEVFGEGAGDVATGPEEPGGGDSQDGGSQDGDSQDGDSQDKEKSDTSSGGDKSQGGGQQPPEVASAVNDIQQALKKLREARSSGNFEKEGEAMAELQNAVKQFKQAKEDSSGN